MVGKKYRKYWYEVKKYLMDGSNFLSMEKSKNNYEYVWSGKEDKYSKYIELAPEKLRDYIYDHIFGYFSPLSLLEVGSGAGRNLLDIKMRVGDDVVLQGLELTESGVKVCKKRGLNVICSSAGDMPFMDNSFDVVFSVHALEQMDSILPSVCSELFRVARLGVILFEPFFCQQNFFGRLHNKRSGYPKDIVGCLVDAGFDIVFFGIDRSVSGSPVNLTGVCVAKKLKNG